MACLRRLRGWGTNLDPGFGLRYPAPAESGKARDAGGRELLELIAARDADFLWMLGEGPGPAGLRLPPGGVDDPDTIAIVRAVQRSVGGDDRPGTWMMVDGGEVVGLIGYGRPPSGGDDVEIGYSVAPRRRRLGYATRAVDLLTGIIFADPAVATISAATAQDNLPSQAVLLRTGFVEVRREVREEDGPVIVWRRRREPSAGDPRT